MTRTELFEFFDRKISKLAIHDPDDFLDEVTIVGKTCRITVDETGEIDIFVCNPTEMPAGLGTRALRTRMEALKSPRNRLAVELNGEGYIKTRDKELVYRNMRLLGVRKKAEFSPERLEQLRNHLAEIRK